MTAPISNGPATTRLHHYAGHYSQHPELIQTSMIFAGNCMRNCWTATSYAEYHRNGCTHAAYSPGCRPLGSHSRLATTPSTMPRRLHRYKTLPARNPRGPNRYKTLPARPKYLFSAHFAPAGRTLYRFHHHQAEQGEKSHARAAPRGAGQALTTPGTP